MVLVDTENLLYLSNVYIVYVVIIACDYYVSHCIMYV